MISIEIISGKEKIWDEIQKIRTLVFHDELGISLDEIFDKYDQKLLQIIILNDEVIIGTLRLRRDDNVMYIERMAILKNFRRAGFGLQGITQVKKFCKESGIQKISLKSILSVQKFYESCGFFPVGDVHLRVGIPHIKMSLDL